MPLFTTTPTRMMIPIQPMESIGVPVTYRVQKAPSIANGIVVSTLKGSSSDSKRIPIRRKTSTTESSAAFCRSRISWAPRAATLSSRPSE